MPKKAKRTISRGVEKMLEKERIKAPKTPADWRELEWRIAAAQAKEAALCSSHSDTVSPDYSKDAHAALMIAENEVEQLRKVTPAADVRALQLKLDTFDPDYDAGYDALKAEVFRFLETLSKSGTVTLLAQPREAA